MRVTLTSAARPLVLDAPPVEHPPPSPPLDAFVGRADALSTLREMIDAHRLITVVGPGGVGKTRLLRELLARREPEPIGRALFVAVDDVHDRADVPGAVAEALAIEVTSAQTPAEIATRVGEAFDRRGVRLLVADNLEHVLGAAEWVRTWLIAAPELTIVATSRVATHLAAEVLMPLAPLSVEPGGHAEVLFRARALASGGRIDRDTPGITALVRRLDGLPLAIELAAARTRLLPPAALLDRLDAGQIELGRGAFRDRPARQSDMDASFAWSWALLGPGERRDLTAVSVFRDPFDGDAALAVLGGAALDGLATLLDHSLLRVLPDGHFGLYAGLRAFAAREGPVDARRAAARRHRQWYFDRGPRYAARAHGSDGPSARRWLRDQRGNLVAATVDALDGGDDPTPGLLALRPLAYIGAAPAEYDRLLDRAVAEGRPVVAGWARCLRGERARLRGRLKSAEIDLTAAVAVYGDARLTATARAELGIVAHQRGDLTAASAHHAAALAGWQRIEDARGIGRALGSQAITLHARADLDAARDRYEQAIDALEVVGDRRSGAIFTSNLGDLHLESGRLGEARTCYEAARADLERCGDRRLAAAVTGNLGGVLLAEGDLMRAIARRREAVDALTAVGDARLAAVFRGYLGLTRHAAGDLKGAERDYLAAEAVLGELGDRRHQGLFAAHRSAALVACGALDAARTAVDDARDALTALDEPAVRAVAMMYRGLLSLAEGDRGPAERGLTLVPGEDGEDLRFARGLLRAALGDGERPVVSRRLLVAEDGSRFDAPGTGPVDLSRRRTMGRILTALIDIRRRSPGAGLDIAALQAAGWPGERMSRASGANRVYVAIATLRRDGLADVLLKRPGGYLLDPAIPLIVEPADGE